jgi:dienelactone hydrolase
MFAAVKAGSRVEPARRTLAAFAIHAALLNRREFPFQPRNYRKNKMTPRSWIILLLAVVSVAPHPARAADSPDREARARAFLWAVAGDDLTAATKDFDETMKKALPGPKLRDIWKDLVAKGGPFKKLGGIRTGKAGKYDIVTARCEFEKAAYDARVVFDADQKITGLFFRPAFEYKAPPYVHRDQFPERAVQVGSGEWALPATLTLPKGDGPFPALVLVHGSGPQDRDETIGPNQPFRDLAWGLTSQGIAVLRYDKRTRAHGDKLAKVKDLTVKEEVLDDALSAVNQLRNTPGINPKKIFILGHSLGAMAAPRLAQLDPDIAGLIVLAGAARPIEEVVIEQLDYVLSLQKDLPEQEKAKLVQIKKDVARLSDPKLSPEDFASGTLLGATFAYWKSVRGLEPTATAARMKQPMLILQGERDYQVTMADFELWKKALSGRKNVTLKSYPKLNHLFMEGTGKAKPAEYEQEGHVARDVIDDIAGWVRKQ